MKKTFVFGSFTLAVLVVIALGVFRRGEAPAAGAQSKRDVPWLDGKWIRYSPGFAQRSKLEFAPAEAATLSPVINVTGTVSFDPSSVAAVGARISGRVRTIRKFEGDEVKVGDTLCEIESAELGQAQASVLSARAHAEAASANEKRESSLSELRVSSQRDAELAHATAAAAKAEWHAAEQRQRALGGNASSEIGILLVQSPIAGKVVDSKIFRGQSVEPSFTLYRVADLGQVWVELAVFERELGHVTEGDEVELSPQTNTAITLKGRVAHVGDVIDLETRSSEVRVVVSNDGSLRPGQSVLAKIHTKGGEGGMLLLPRDAVTSVDGKPTVFVANDATSVEPRQVTTGARDGTRVEITSGLKPGEKIAITGVFALKSELFR